MKHFIPVIAVSVLILFLECIHYNGLRPMNMGATSPKDLILGNWVMKKSKVISYSPAGKTVSNDSTNLNMRMTFTRDLLNAETFNGKYDSFPYAIESRNGKDSLIIKNSKFPASSGMMINNTEITTLNSNTLELSGSYTQYDPATKSMIKFVHVRTCKKVK